MTSFFYAGLGEAFCTMGAAGTVRMHMILDVIRSGDDGKMNAVMTFLRSLLLSGGFAKAFVLFYRRLLKPSDEGGLELFLEFLFNCSFSPRMVWFSSAMV